MEKPDFKRDISIPFVLRTLDVEKKARDAGAKNLPPVESETLDATQQGVVAYFGEAVGELRNACQALLSELASFRDDLVNKINLDRAKLTIKDLLASFKQKAEAAAMKHRDILSQKREVQGRADRFRRHFASKHSLEHRPASYPESLVNHLAVIGVIAFIEWIALSVFYAEGSDFGLLGGVLLAAAFSIANLGLTLMVGYVWRYFIHLETSRKLLGLLACTILGGLFVFVTLIAAHYRVATLEIAAASSRVDRDISPSEQVPTRLPQREQWGAAKQSWVNLSTDPLHLPDALAWLTVVFAILFGIFAAYKGYKLDDPYPGYGAVDKAYKGAQKEYGDAKDSYRSTIEQLFSETKQGQRHVFEETEHNMRRYIESIRESESLPEHFETQVLVAEQNCNAVIQEYRQINKYVANAPRPPYFSNKVEILAQFKNLSQVVSAGHKTQRDKYEAEIHDLSQYLDAQNVTCHEAFSEALRKYQDLIDKLEQDIEQRLDREFPNRIQS